MPPFVGSIATSLLPLGLWLYALWKWLRSWKSDEGQQPKWRFVPTVLALVLSGISTGLSTFLLWHAAFTGGYPFYHPVELFCIRVGFFSALAALGVAPVGQQKQRLAVTAVSIVDLVLWFCDAIAQ